MKFRKKIFLASNVLNQVLSDSKTAVLDVSIPLVSRRWREGEKCWRDGDPELCPWRESGCGDRGDACSTFSRISWK